MDLRAWSSVCALGFETPKPILLEATQMGSPVVTNRRASLPETIQEGANGLPVEGHNPPDLAEKILRLATDVEMRVRMGSANRGKFQQQYTHANVTGNE